jgi:hypothetical protein
MKTAARIAAAASRIEFLKVASRPAMNKSKSAIKLSLLGSPQMRSDESHTVLSVINNSSAAQVSCIRRKDRAAGNRTPRC